MKKKSLLSKLVLAALASGMLCANVGFAANVTKSANDITADYTLNKGDTLTLTGGVLSHNIQGSGDVIIDGSVVLMEGKAIGSVLTINQGRDLKVDGVLAGATNNKGVLNLGNGATNTGIIRNYGTINIGDGFIIGNQIASGQTGSDTVNITGTVVENGVESGKYAVGASVLNVTGADITSDNRRSLRAYETTITNSIVDTEIRGLWRGDSPTNEVYGNTLTVVNSTLKQSAAAGQNSTYQETMGNVYNNSVSISGSEVVSVDGAYNVIYDSTSLTKAYTAGDVYGNSVTIGNNSTVTIEVYGGESFVKKNGEGSPYFSQHKTGNVYNNSVEITNSTVKGTVYGGYSRDGNVSNNTVNFVKAKLAADIYGGDTVYGSVDGNKVIITSETPNSGETNIDGGTDGIDIVGGFIKLNSKSNATNNEVIINGAKIEGSDNIIAGGKSAGGSANGNSVKLSEIGLKNTTEALIAGGYVRAIFDPSVTSPVVLGSANNNKVVMNGYVLSNGAGASVYGGYIGAEGFDKTSEEHKTALKKYYSDGGASNNTVEITPSDSEVSVVLYDVYGGSTVTGNANDNTVKLNGKNIVVEHHIYGGYSGTGNVTGNSLTLLDGKYLDDINARGLARYVGGFSEVGDVSANQVILGADTTTPKFYGSAWVIGGASVDADDKSKGIVSGNNITIYNAAFNLVESGEEVVQRYTHIVAGRGGDGDVTNNNLVIKNITLNSNIGTADISKNNVWGGFAQNEGNVSGNNITIEKGILNINLMAGGSSNFGAATNNTVTITGKDTVINGGTIFGGRCYQGEGEVSGNVVDISDATIKANVSGGWTSVENKAHDNKVFLNAVTVGSSVEETYSINASKDNKENKGGVVQVKDGGLVNNANLTLGGGKVKIDGNITGAGNLTINSNTGEINASVTQTSLTLGKEGITTNTVTASMDNIHVTTLTNNGTFNVSGTLNQAINGNGTNKVLQNTILSLGANASLNNLTLAGTLNLQNDAYATTTIANLTANTGSKVNFDAKFSATGDQISATTASGTLALGSIGLKEDFAGEVGESKTYTLLKDGAANIALTGSAEAVMGAYKYVFTVGDTAGTLKVTKEYGYSLQAIIQDSEPNHVAGKVSNYSLNGDKTLDADLGTLTRVDSSKPREFTINGNGNKLLGNGKNGITVNSGDTLTYKDIAEVSGFNGAAVTNNGTFNLQGVTMKNGIAGSGTMNIDGIVNADAKVSNKMNIVGSGTLNIAGANVANTVANEGTFNFLGGNLNYVVTGGGTTNVKDNATFNAKVDNVVTVVADKTLTTAANNLAGAVTNSGTVVLSDGTVTKDITGGKVQVNGNVIIAKGVTVDSGTTDTVGNGLTIANDKSLTVNGTLKGYVDNGGTLTLADGSSLVGYVETVKDSAAPSIINMTGAVSLSKKEGVTSKNISVVGKKINITDATVTENDGRDIRAKVLNVSNSTVNANVAGLAQRTNNFASSNNTFTITNSTMNGHVHAAEGGNLEGTYGGVTNNTLTVTGSTITGDIIGGKSDAGNVTGNTVSVTNTTVGGNIYGGWTNTNNKAASNTVNLDNVIFSSGTHVVYASRNNMEGKGGLIQVKNGGLVNNDSLTLGGGKVQIDGNVTGSGNLTISSNTGEINASVTQNSLTIGKEGNTTNTLTASMDNIHVTALTNHGTFNVSGTLNQAINGNGTNKVLENTILSLGANASLNNLTLAGTLNLQNDAYATTTIANLTANTGSKVNFDAKFSATGDQISATTASGTLALGSIGLKEDFEGDVGTSKAYTLLKDGAANIALTGSAEAVMGAYKYVFTVGDTAGTLKVTKDYGYSLQAIIQDSEPNHVAGKVSNYSLNGDKTLDADLGTLTRVDSAKAREFTINGNGNKLLGNGKNGITVNSGDTLTYKDIAEVSGFNGAAVTNNGTFKLQGVTMKNGIAGSGTTVVENGTSAFEANVANAVKVAANGVLKSKGAYITNTVDNAGEYHFLGGEVNGAVNGAGTMFVEDNALFNAPVGNSLSVASGKMVTGNVDLSVARIDLNNAVLNMASGKKLAVTSKLNMIGEDTVVTLDKDNVLDAALKVKSGLGDIINGVDGLLVLRFGGAEYTATSHKNARLALFGNGENAALQFDNAVLKIDTVNETLGVQGQKNGNEVTMSGVQPTVYDKSGGEVEPVGAQGDKTVGIIDNTGALVTADKVSLDGASNVTAKDLQIESVVTAGQTFEVSVNGASTLSLVGSDGYLVRNKSNVAVTANIAVESSTLVIGQEGAASPTAINGLDTLTITNSAASLYNVIMNAVKLAMGAGGKLWIDPSYVKSDTITIASGASVGAATDGSVLNIAMTENNLQKALEAAGVELDADSKLVGAENGVFAYNAKTLGTLDLTGDRHLVVADEPGDQYALELGAGSVLVVETAKDKDAAFKVESAEDVSVDGNTAKLVVSADDFEVGVSEYKILITPEGEFDELWLADNVFASDPTYKLTFKGAGSVYTLTTDWNKVEGIFGEDAISAPEMYNRMLQKGSGTDANGFLKGVINATAGAGSTAASKAAGANALNSASNLNGVANVEHGLYTAFNMGSEALYTHLADKGQERGIWASYINNKETVDGFNLGAGLQADYDAKYNGVIVGADLVKTGKSIMGMSLSYTTGDVTSNGNIRTNNDSKYYGVSLYGKMELGEGTEAALLYDVSYMHGKSEITQHNFGKEITADAKSDAFSVGLRAEKGFKMGQGSLTPYIGLRYLHIGTGNYESKLKMKYDAADLNMVLLPVGLTYKANIQSGKTTWSPMVSAGYLWNLSGKDTTQNVFFDGVESSFDYDVADRGSFFARLGIEAQVKNATYGIGYQFMKGSSTKNSRWNVSVNFSF